MRKLTSGHKHRDIEGGADDGPSGFAPIMCAYLYTVVMVLHQTPARKGRVRYTARVKLVLTPTSVERLESGYVRLLF